ncbi:alpha/beta fold hydrolase [Pseudonocardia sp. CA-107938]|uniref:alpha/beta fold hydrolase n=1 Tax=Pseudonocardia sp. CA-107938 TaxID=3240021 RepID=UPI003D9137EA
MLLPGSGSDDRFVRSAFAGPLSAFGITAVTPVPRPGAAVVDGYRAALDAAAAEPGPLVVGGVSLGAHVATAWAVRHCAALGSRLRGVFVALPAWTGPAGAAPAAQAARATAQLVREAGVAGALAQAAAGSPPWLADELGRAWPRYGPGLAPALDAAAVEPAPTADELAGLDVPVGIVALADDPVHPLAVARRWCAALPRAELVISSLAAFGADPELAGRASLLAWLKAGGR